MAWEKEKLIAARRRMVQSQLRGRGIKNEAVLAAFLETPRERFIPPEQSDKAYSDCPLPIGHGQTISQPYIVALMLQELDPQPDDRVLDVGAGSGYQTALLARLVRHVYAVERIEALAERAEASLAAMNVANFSILMADGSMGWPEEAPFDGIICGAASPSVPQPWIDQLADGRRIILPVGPPDGQMLLSLCKEGQKIRRREVCAVRFVRLLGKAAWPED